MRAKELIEQVLEGKELKNILENRVWMNDLKVLEFGWDDKPFGSIFWAVLQNKKDGQKYKVFSMNHLAKDRWDDKNAKFKAMDLFADYLSGKAKPNTSNVLKSKSFGNNEVALMF